MLRTLTLAMALTVIAFSASAMAQTMEYAVPANEVGVSSEGSTGTSGYPGDIQPYQGQPSPQTGGIDPLPPTDTPDIYVASGCKLFGCQQEECVESTRPEPELMCPQMYAYTCYRITPGTRCEKQSNGHCGWTKTPALQACLSGKQNTGRPIPMPRGGLHH